VYAVLCSFGTCFQYTLYYIETNPFYFSLFSIRLQRYEKKADLKELNRYYCSKKVLLSNIYALFVKKAEKVALFAKIFLEIFGGNENLPYLCTRFAQKGSKNKRSLKKLHRQK